MTATTDTLDPFAAGGMAASVQDADREGWRALPLAELHRRWAALADEYRRLCDLDGDCNVAGDDARGAFAIWEGDPPSRAAICFYSEAEIDAEAIARRRDRLADTATIERMRVATRERLAEHRAIAAAIEAEGGVDALREKIAEIGDRMGDLGDEISDRPVRTPYDLAALLDLELEDGGGSPDPGAHFWPAKRITLEGAAALAPGFVFTYYRRLFPGMPLDPAGIPLVESAEADDEAHPLTELRRRAEALAAEYDLPLPAGDAGLIEAERRRAALAAAEKALSAEFRHYDLGPDEDDALAPVGAADDRLWRFIHEEPASSAAGIAVKLRVLRSRDPENADEDATLGQCIDALDRLAG